MKTDNVVSQQQGRLTQDARGYQEFPCKVKMQSTKPEHVHGVHDRHFFWDKLGIPKDKIDFILLPDVERVLSFKRRLVNIAPLHPPFYKPIEQTGIASVLITSREIAGLDAWTGMWAFTESLSGTTSK